MKLFFVCVILKIVIASEKYDEPSISQESKLNEVRDQTNHNIDLNELLRNLTTEYNLANEDGNGTRRFTYVINRDNTTDSNTRNDENKFIYEAGNNIDNENSVYKSSLTRLLKLKNPSKNRTRKVKYIKIIRYVPVGVEEISRSNLANEETNSTNDLVDNSLSINANQNSVLNRGFHSSMNTETGENIINDDRLISNKTAESDVLDSQVSDSQESLSNNRSAEMSKDNDQSSVMSVISNETAGIFFNNESNTEISPNQNEAMEHKNENSTNRNDTLHRFKTSFSLRNASNQTSKKQFAGKNESNKMILKEFLKYLEEMGIERTEILEYVLESQGIKVSGLNETSNQQSKINNYGKLYLEANDTSEKDDFQNVIPLNNSSKSDGNMISVSNSNFDYKNNIQSNRSKLNEVDRIYNKKNSSAQTTEVPVMNKIQETKSNDVYETINNRHGQLISSNNAVNVLQGKENNVMHAKDNRNGRPRLSKLSKINKSINLIDNFDVDDFDTDNKAEDVDFYDYEDKIKNIDHVDKITSAKNKNGNLRSRTEAIVRSKNLPEYNPYFMRNVDFIDPPTDKPNLTSIFDVQFFKYKGFHPNNRDTEVTDDSDYTSSQLESEVHGSNLKNIIFRGVNEAIRIRKVISALLKTSKSILQELKQDYDNSYRPAREQPESKMSKLFELIAGKLKKNRANILNDFSDFIPQNVRNLMDTVIFSDPVQHMIQDFFQDDVFDLGNTLVDNRHLKNDIDLISNKNGIDEIIAEAIEILNHRDLSKYSMKSIVQESLLNVINIMTEKKVKKCEENTWEEVKHDLLLALYRNTLSLTELPKNSEIL